VVIVGALNNDAGGANAGRAYLYLSSSPPIVPRMMSVQDIPNDQGTQVRVRWTRSGYDVPGTGRLSEYIVQRSDPPGQTGFVWDYVATIPALRQPSYSYIAPTLADSSTNSSATFYFRVIARGTNPDEVWCSQPLASHSVDNLSPMAPASASLTDLANGSILLHWNPNLVDPDVGHYTLYRSRTNGFPLADSTRLKTTADTTIVDTPAVAAKYYYRITTVDIHENESPPTVQLTTPNIRAGLKYFLQGPYNSAAGVMNNGLKTGGHLAAHFVGVAIPANAVDSINIEIRNAPTAAGSTTRMFIPAWLLTDGTLRSFSDTTKNYIEYESLSGSYYVVVRHRNHLAVMSANAVAL
ncbi:MAG: hypothetical protein AAB393_10765, partial [Bacteroidota bacterium]